MSANEKLPPDLLVMREGSERKILETRDLAQLRTALGPGVLEEFCRCFLQMDRLLSFRSLAYYSNQSATAAGKQRDLHTVIWMLIGTLREIGFAFDGLRAVLNKAGLFEKGQDWEEAQEIVERANRERKRLRDQGSFHIEPELITKGLEGLSESGGTTVISVQEGGNDLGFTFQLAIDALYNGVGMNEAEVERFMKSLLGDVDRVVTLLSKIFVATIRRAKIPGIKI